jgi:hypothetical protein
MAEFDLGLTFHACDLVEKRNLENWAGGNKDSLPILQLLCDFAEERLSREAAKRDPIEAVRGLRELRDALAFLVKTNNPEFQRMYDDTRKGMDRLGRAARTSIVRKFLSTNSPEEVEECMAGLIELISEGYWPGWQEEFEAEVERHRMRRLSDAGSGKA